MFDIKMTVNGKPITKTNVKNEIERALFENAIETAKEKISNTISSKEASQITIDVIGTGIDNLSLNINGPDEIIEKINKSIS